MYFERNPELYHCLGQNAGICQRHVKGNVRRHYKNQDIIILLEYQPALKALISHRMTSNIALDSYKVIRTLGTRNNKIELSRFQDIYAKQEQLVRVGLWKTETSRKNDTVYNNNCSLPANWPLAREKLACKLLDVFSVINVENNKSWR